MDIDLYNKFFAANPLCVNDTHGEVITFTTIPNYADIEALCRNNPEFKADEARIGAIEIIDNQVLMDLERYRDDLLDSASELEGQILAAYEDILRSAQSYYKAEREQYAREVLEHIGANSISLDIMMEGFSTLNDDVVLAGGEEYQGVFDDMFNVFLNAYQKIIDPEAEANLDVQNYSSDFDTNLEAAFNIAGEDVPTITMTFEDGEKDIPLTFEMMGVLAEEMPLLPADLEEFFEIYSASGDRVFDPRCAVDAMREEKQAIFSSPLTQSVKNSQIAAIDEAITHLMDFYQVEMDEKVSAFIDNTDCADDVENAMHVLEQWISGLTHFKKGDYAQDYSMEIHAIEFADTNITILKQLYANFSDEVNDRENEALDYKASGLRNAGSKDSKTTLGTYMPNILNLH
tara:strand:- start:54941 stop:56149 length:1209 start_codon:yes stop_codon:yes gene_type:complete